MSAPFRFDGWVFSSSAFDVLGDVAGYNAHEARGRWARAGSEATERQSYVFTEAAVRGLFGAQGVEALLAAELAERVDGGLRMLRMDGAIEWYADITSKRRRAGQARAANAPRDERGRLLPASTPSTGPAQAGVLDQQAASRSPALASSPVPVPDPVPDPISETHTRVRERHPAAGGIARRTWEYAAQLRGTLKVQSPPWGATVNQSDPGWPALLDRISEQLVEHTPEQVEQLCRNRVDVAAAKARADGDGQWFASATMFTPNSFATWAHLTPEQVARKPARRGAGFGQAAAGNEFTDDEHASSFAAVTK